MDKIDIIMIVMTFALLIYWAITFVVPNLISPLETLYDWLVSVSLTLGYTGAFIVSFLGNATILVPFPYIGVPYILGGVQDPNTAQFLFDPTVVGLVAGAGALIGEMTGYVAGYAGGSLIDEEKRNAFLKMVDQHPKSTPIILWFLAVTPLPDDVLIIPLGASKYSWWKVAIPQFIGKVMFLAAISWAGRLSMTWIDTFVSGASSGGVIGRTIETTSLLLVFLIIYLIVKFNGNK